MAGKEGIEVEFLTPEVVKDFADSKIGPFLNSLRVACPDKNFGQRRTTHCIECPWFRGVGMREVSGNQSPTDHADAVRLYKIICGCPMGRAIRFFPED